MEKTNEPLTSGIAFNIVESNHPTIIARPSGSAIAGPSGNVTSNGKQLGTKRKKATINKKPFTNKQAGIITRKRSIAWDHFKKVPDEEVSEPTTKCMQHGIIFLCVNKEYDISNMLGHIPKCPKNSL